MSVKSWTFAVSTLVVAAIGNSTLAESRLKTIHEAIAPIAKQSAPGTTESLETEIVDSISLQLPNLYLEPAVKTILQYIVETRKLPANAKLSFTAKDILCLDLCLTENAQSKTGYRLILRHPALRRLDDGTLLLHEKWKPSENELWTWKQAASRIATNHALDRSCGSSATY